MYIFTTLKFPTHNSDLHLIYTYQFTGSSLEKWGASDITCEHTYIEKEKGWDIHYRFGCSDWSLKILVLHAPTNTARTRANQKRRYIN